MLPMRHPPMHHHHSIRRPLPAMRTSSSSAPKHQCSSTTPPRQRQQQPAHGSTECCARPSSADASVCPSSSCPACRAPHGSSLWCRCGSAWLHRATHRHRCRSTWLFLMSASSSSVRISVSPSEHMCHRCDTVSWRTDARRFRSACPTGHRRKCTGTHQVRCFRTCRRACMVHGCRSS